MGYSVASSFANISIRYIYQFGIANRHNWKGGWLGKNKFVVSVEHSVWNFANYDNLNHTKNFYMSKINTTYHKVAG